MYKYFIKRLLDLLISFISLLILSPIVVFLTIIGVLVFKGNPFFVQERPGKNNKIFKLIKFKSMTDKKDEDGNLLPDGDRYTSFGMFLRKTSLDELPELFNIIKGDMAIIGPRPLLVTYLDLYTEEEKHRHDVRPGLTGLAQVNGRNYLTWEEVFKYDLEYVNNISFINDLRIIYKTIKEVLSADVEDRSEVINRNGQLFVNDNGTLRLIHAPLDIERKKTKEIGSDFYNISLSSEKNDLFNDACWFISGRAALNFIIKDILSKKKIESIAVPSWCCDTMLDPIINNGLKYEFYPITIKDGKINKDFNNIKSDVLLNLNYFGYYDDNQIDFDGLIINDVTHSIFTQSDNTSDYAFGSLRKWTGFVTGGFAKCKDGFSIKQPDKTSDSYIKLKQKAMKLKKNYIDNNIRNKDEYRELFNVAEGQLSNTYELAGYKEDINDAQYLDIEKLRIRRQRNAKYLINRLSKYVIFKEIKKEDCPLFVPIIVPNHKRDELRKYLIDNNVYCPIHWPLTNKHINLNNDEKYIYDNELSLVCDQRYNINDMDYMCKKIEEFLGC